MTEVVGYFNWRATQRGGVTYEKILIDHWKVAKHSPNHRVLQDYTHNLLYETPLDSETWRLPIGELASKFPLPDGIKAKYDAK